MTFDLALHLLAGVIGLALAGMFLWVAFGRRR